MNSSAPAHESSAKALRVEAEEAFGETLRAYIAKSGAKFVDVARVLGIQRVDLYEVMDSAKHCRAAWLALLPPDVERLYLADRAAHHGLELVPVASAEVAFSDAAEHFGAALAQCAASEADGEITVAEAEADLTKIAALEAALAGMKARRVRAIEQRGLRVVTRASR